MELAESSCNGADGLYDIQVRIRQYYSPCWNIGTMFTSKISVVVEMRISDFHAC